MKWVQCDVEDRICLAFVQHVLPIVTTVLTILVGSISLPAVYASFKSRMLPTGLNPTPFPWLVTLCMTAIIYGFYLRDYVLIVSNIPGLLISLSSTLVFYDCAEQRHKSAMLLSLLLGLGSSLICGLFSFIILDSHRYQSLPIGIGFAASIVVFYSSPLISVGQAIKTRSSSAFYLPLVITSVFTTTSWVAYGIVLGDLFMIVPNGLAALCTYCQLVCCIVFPRQSKYKDSDLDVESNGNVQMSIDEPCKAHLNDKRNSAKFSSTSTRVFV